MMASNLLSRILPSATDQPFEPEPSNPQPRRSSTSTDGQRDMDIDEENFGAYFEPQDLEHLLEEASASQITADSRAVSPETRRPLNAPPGINTANRAAGWKQPPPAPVDDDDDVPQSLLLEGGPLSPQVARRSDGLPPPVPGPATRQTRAQWDTTQRQQRLHDEMAGPPASTWGRTGQFNVSPKDRALWLWVNQTDLDAYMKDVYEYYRGHGIYSMLLKRFLTLLQSAFVVGFMTFLGWCIDYSVLSQSHMMSEVLVPKCTSRIHGFWIFALWVFSSYWIYSFYTMITDVPRLRAMHDFYHHLLDIPDRDIQTVEWQQVVSRVMALRDLNLTTASNLSPETRKLLDSKSRQRLDAIDIASRLMRRENYLIALFNKEVLDVTVPIPFLGNRYIFSETTRWHVELAILEFVFSGKNGQFNTEFLKERNRRELVKRLRTRLMWVGLISVVCAPFAVVFVLASYLFKYFAEYHKDPGQLSNRDFTHFAQWKFREFNELPHLFERRLKMAQPYANMYLAQFPKDKTEQISSFIAFVTGAFAFVLVALTLLDSEQFLNFEITPGKTAIFWIGVFTAIYRSARGSSPQEDQISDPAFYLGHVTYHTRHEPESWTDRLHTDEVRAEFAKLYQPKVLIFAEEILSMVITPFLLIFRLPRCSERIVDFFREFSIVVDGLGVTCSYSMFPFNKGTQNRANNIPASQPGGTRANDPGNDPREDYFMAKDNKMLASYYGFMDTYGNPSARGYNNRLQGRSTFHPPPQFPNTFGSASQTGQLGDTGHARGTSKGPTSRQPRHLQRRAPKLAARDEPMSSMLLDPHHQPSASALRGSPRGASHGRYQPRLHAMASPPGHAGARIEEESTIGDSWRTSRLAQDDEDEDEAPGAGRGGVLQLLQQFSKAQAEGRGAGVGV
ncbi:autophagy protein Apg9-domain-containing protein [Boeremia exigua]|uniref:autophagy protein Apg9-domain-containing protein n=1 Tax=Boeremia exigua TaxID=749465 RepID=UPI001E8DC9A0|nr:autophagy protein Apg9-domain-containing protein [Boeremia exigua]KAH6643963.1 autophagy protein Apg9-domain-containing protein [Boeremia exigua]